MKSRLAVLVCILSIASPVALADTIVATAPDTALGKGIGGMSGILIGGAVAGPIGAIGAALAGLWAGGEMQRASGMHGEAYVVERDDGSKRTVRSPTIKMAIGEQVQIIGRRPVPVGVAQVR